MSIYVGLLFNNEVDLLPIVVNMYLPHVAGIDIVQSAVSLSGRPKKIFMTHNPWAPKVKLTTIHNLSIRKNFKTEDFSVLTYSRRMLGNLINHRNPKKDDCIFVPDLDEIVNPDILKHSCKLIKPGQTIQFYLMWFFSNFWQLALPGTWNIKAMTMFQTFKHTFSNDPGAVRTASKNIVRMHTSSYNQCYNPNKKIIGWHCTWCFRKRIEYVQKLSHSSHVRYFKFSKNKQIVDNMICKGHWLNEGVHGSVHHCRILPNNSETLLSKCAMYNVIPKVAPSASECPEYIFAPCSRRKLQETCVLMNTHLDERNSIWMNYLKTCLL